MIRKNQTFLIKKTIALLLILVCFGYKGKGQGISSNTQGFSVSAYGAFSSFKSTSFWLNSISELDDSGYGFGVEIGYGITEAIKVFAGYQASNFNLNDNWDNNAVDIFEAGLKYNFLGSLSRARPYLSGSVAWNSVSISPAAYTDEFGNFIDDVKLKSSGYSVNAGVGLQYFLSPDLNIDLGVGARFGNFTENFANGNPITLDEDVDFRYLFGKIGLTYSFY